MSKRSETCIHADACQRMAKLTGKARTQCTDCECYDPVPYLEYTIEGLSAIMAQAGAGAKHYEKNFCAHTWFSRIYVIADHMMADLTKAELTDFTENSTVYPHGFWDNK